MKKNLGLFFVCLLCITLGCTSVSQPGGATEGNPTLIVTRVLATTTPSETYLPLVVTAEPELPPGGSLLLPSDFIYLGAFRLPDASDRPFTFEYGGVMP